MNDSPAHRFQSLLLLGPTVSGKTPLGHWLQDHGLGDRPCHHFDFGANLRNVVAAGPTPSFSAEEVQFLRGVLEQGVLLENESFYLASKILDEYITANKIQFTDWLILNGLPRHIGQAEALATKIHVTAIIHLECTAAVVLERLRRNTGGDRAVRTDDDATLVVRKLATYEERTRVLVDYYRERGARYIGIPVGAGTSAAEMAASLMLI